MAVIHRATLHPTKLELLAGWIPGRRWYSGPDDAPLTPVGAFRFDDPAGEVGVETLLIAAGPAVLQVPLTYRGAPLPGADDHLVGTMEHSVLGRRWVYDACGDPVYATALAAAILAGTAQAAEMVEVDGRLEPREPSVTVTPSAGASGPAPEIEAVRAATDSEDATSIVTGPVVLTVVRSPGPDAPAPSGTAPALTAVWSGRSAPVVLALAHRTAE